MESVFIIIVFLSFMLFFASLATKSKTDKSKEKANGSDGLSDSSIANKPIPNNIEEKTSIAQPNGGTINHYIYNKGVEVKTLHDSEDEFETLRFRVNNYIEHKKFGIGKIISTEFDSIEVVFYNEGIQKLETRICINENYIRKIGPETIAVQIIKEELEKQIIKEIEKKEHELKNESKQKDIKQYNGYVGSHIKPPFNIGGLKKKHYNYNPYKRRGKKYFKRVKRK